MQETVFQVLLPEESRNALQLEIKNFTLIYLNYNPKSFKKWNFLRNEKEK